MGKRNKVGPPVSGKDFFERPKEINKIMRALRSDHHILISSPRRVGKTSILFRLADMGEENYYFLYVITQSINSENDFYKRLYWAVVDCDSLSSNTLRLTHKAKSFLKNTIAKVKSIKGIDLAPGKEQNFKDLFIKVLKSVSLEGSKIIIMIDEFTQTIENIIRKEGDDQAVELLQSIREIRHDDEIRNNVLFILTGSVGLENIAARLNSVDLIGDLNSIKVSPLKEKEASELIKELLEGSVYALKKEHISYILKKIEWFIPFYIQLFVQEIQNVCDDRPAQKITKSALDTAFRQMLDHRNHFEHWQTRLKKTFKKEEYRFAEEALNSIAKNKAVSSNDLLNIAVKRQLEDDYKKIIRVLIHDGYINNNDDPEVYRFNSPILRTWWFNNVTH